MFEAAELGRKVSKEEYREQVPGLRMELLRLQFELREREFPVIVVLAGNDRESCYELLNLLHEWMDPRFVEGNAWGTPTAEERERPLFWRYWRTLPPGGASASSCGPGPRRTSSCACSTRSTMPAWSTD